MNQIHGSSVRVAAPCRADLAGGTLDIWPLGLLHPNSMTVNMALAVEVVLEVDLEGEAGAVEHATDDGVRRHLGRSDAGSDLTAAIVFAMVPDGGARVRVERQAPYRSGIGGSSSYGIALARALGTLGGSVPREDRLVALVRDLEARVLGVPTGVQDHWAAVRGGVLAVHLEPGGNRLEPLNVPADWLGDRVTVFFSGITHHSGMVNWRVIRRRLDGERDSIDAFNEIAAAARDCRAGLIAHDGSAVAAAIRREWAARKCLAPEVNPPELDGPLRLAMENGAEAVKACGAGGGGSFVIWHQPEDREAIVASLAGAATGARLLASGAAGEGCRLLGDR